MDLVPNEYKSINRPGVLPGSAAGGRPGGALRGLNFSAAEGVSLRPWLILAAALLALVILVYAGLWFYQRSLSEAVRELNKKNDEALALLDKKTVKNLIDAKTNAEIISGLLTGHKLSSRLIDALAAATLPKTRWLSLSAAFDKNSLSLAGQAADYGFLAKQITALRADDNWQNIEISDITLEKDGFVSFGLNMEFAEKVMQ